MATAAMAEEAQAEAMTQDLSSRDKSNVDVNEKENVQIFINVCNVSYLKG